MPRTTQDFRRVIERSWNHATSTSFKGMTVRLNNTADDFDANGWGTSSETSSAVIYALAGTANMSGVCVMRYVAPTTSANCALGVMARLASLEATADTDYVRFWLSAGTVTINQVIGGSTGSNLSSAAFALPQNTEMTITWSVIDNVATASFAASGVTTANIATSGITLLDPGGMGARSTSRTIRVKSFTGRIIA